MTSGWGSSRGQSRRRRSRTERDTLNSRCKSPVLNLVFVVVNVALLRPATYPVHAGLYYRSL